MALHGHRLAGSQKFLRGGPFRLGVRVRKGQVYLCAVRQGGESEELVDPVTPPSLEDSQNGIVRRASHRVPSSQASSWIRPAEAVQFKVEKRGPPGRFVFDVELSCRIRWRLIGASGVRGYDPCTRHPASPWPCLPACHSQPRSGSESLSHGTELVWLCRLAVLGPHKHQRLLNCLAMCRPRAVASGIGTALPICLVI